MQAEQTFFVPELESLAKRLQTVKRFQTKTYDKLSPMRHNPDSILKPSELHLPAFIKTRSKFVSTAGFKKQKAVGFALPE